MNREPTFSAELSDAIRAIADRPPAGTDPARWRRAHEVTVAYVCHGVPVNDLARLHRVSSPRIRQIIQQHLLALRHPERIHALAQFAP